MSTVRLEVKRLSQIVPPPRYAHQADAGLDLCAAEDVTIKPGKRALVSTGLAVAIPPGYAGFVQPRSGSAAKKGLGIVNSPGLIDSGYRGEVKVVLINLDPGDPIGISRGDKIAQLVIVPVPEVEVVLVDELSATERGEGGFGSTGV